MKRTVSRIIALLMIVPTSSAIYAKESIVATTGMIADAVRNIAKDHYEVIALMGPGVDPHSYKATAGDLVKLKKASIVFYNGLHLEGKMDYIFKKLASSRKIYAISDAIPQDRLIKDPDFDCGIDPHIWFDVSLWKGVVWYICALLQQADPAHAEAYVQNAKKYILDLDKLDHTLAALLANIPEKNRILITSHDAFSYFGKAYNVRVKSLQGISTMPEYGLKDRNELVNFIIKHHVKAIFVETAVADKSMRAIVESCQLRGYHVKIGEPLYADAMGEDNTPEGTYVGMLMANVASIVKHLS